MQKQLPDADDWFNGLLKAIYSLENFLNRCQLAPESRELRLKLRQLLYRDCRILFLVVPGDEEFDGIVQILRVRHVSEERLKLENL